MTTSEVIRAIRPEFYASLTPSGVPAMSFMQAQQTGRATWVETDGPHGTNYIPAEFVSLPEMPDGSDTPTDADLLSDDYPEEFTAAVRAAVSDYVEGSADDLSEVKLTQGYGVRSSAPGYLDCTEWTVYASEGEARDAYYEEILENDESDPTATAYQVSRYKLTRPDMLRAFRWFMSETEHVSNGRVPYAADLARAEEWFTDLANSERAEWVYDPDTDANGEPGAWVFTLRVKDEDGDTLSTESLGGIDIGADCEPGRDIPYVRLTLAELALELYREFLPSD